MSSALQVPSTPTPTTPSPTSSPRRAIRRSPSSTFPVPTSPIDERLSSLRIQFADILAIQASLLDPPSALSWQSDDATLAWYYRFLCGQKFNPEVAAAKMNESHAWRQAGGLDKIRAMRAKCPTIVQRSLPFAERIMAVHPHNITHGEDLHGQPLSVERLGRANPKVYDNRSGERMRHLTRTVPYSSLHTYHLHHMESKSLLLESLTVQRGHIVRSAKIIDCDGLSRAHIHRRGLDYLKGILDVSQRNYPEMLGVLYVVNAPWTFTMCWTIIKPWLHPSTLSKIRILSAGEETLQVLGENIAKSNIPDFIEGGECTCEEHGGCVPLTDPDANMTKVNVRARGDFEHVVRIDQKMIDDLKLKAEREELVLRGDIDSVTSSTPSPTSSLPSPFLGVLVEYEFRTDHYDIGFEVISESANRASKAAPVVVVESQRHSSDESSIFSSFVITAPCVLTFTFDNSFSMFTSKDLSFRVDVDAATNRTSGAEDEVTSDPETDGPIMTAIMSIGSEK